MKVVQFEDGNYAIRKGFWPFYRYLDLISPSFSWPQESRHIKDCLTKDKTRICEALTKRTTKRVFETQDFCKDCE